MSINNNAKEFDVLIKKYQGAKKRLPNKIAITAVNFFKRNFKVGGFVDSPFRKWKDSTNPRKRGTTLVQSGRLRRSIKKLKVSFRWIVVGVPSDVKYARIHNEGGNIPITPKMRRYFWAMYKKTGADYWKALALTSKKHITIPERTFIDDSVVLEKDIKTVIINELEKSLTQ